MTYQRVPETFLLDICKSFDLNMSDGRGMIEHLQGAADVTRRYLGSHVTAILIQNNTAQDHTLVVSAGGDEALVKHIQERCARDRNNPCYMSLIHDYAAIEINDLQLNDWELVSLEQARKYDLVAVLAFPLFIDGMCRGLLCHFSSSLDQTDDQTKVMLSFLASRIQALITQDIRFRHVERYQQLHRITTDLLSQRDVDTLLKYLLDNSLKLVNADRGWVSHLNYRTGELEITNIVGNPQNKRSLQPGHGITWHALMTEQPILVDDVYAEEWHSKYEAYWSDTKSELAVPLVISNAEVRQRTELKEGSKTNYVLNMESPYLGAFTSMDKELLHSLARHAAVLIDALELNRRLTDLTTAQQEMTITKGWDNILDLMGKTIKNTIGFDYVNISLVTPDMKRIRTEYVLGIQDNLVDEFKTMANHELSGDDIQAAIVHTPQIQVPDVDDNRFDKRIFARFGHDKLIRVFVPMIASNKAVLGTLDAGYLRDYRKYIFEQDVRSLEGFIGYAVRALEQRQQAPIDKISHELSAPLAGIRSNVSFLQRHWETLEVDKKLRKLDDIAIDTEIMQLAVSALEYIVSGRVSADVITSAKVTKPKPVYVFRDVIIKTVMQLAPIVRSLGFDPAGIVYDTSEITRIPPLYLEQTKLNQVIYNLLLNAIKYADEDPQKFHVEIKAEAREAYIIKVRDRGIGIRADLADKLFAEGYRTPEAIAKHVSGSGLGLAISRQFMHQMGGDLQLVHASQPTEFHVILPKALRQEPKGGLHNDDVR